MAERTQKQKSTQKRKTEEVAEVAPAKSDEEIKAETESILDEIDSVLEVNAEEFVKGFVQKGGQ